MNATHHFSRQRSISPLLIFIILVGTVLRFYGLSVQSLWNDEFATWRMSHFDNLAAVINQGVRPDVHPPGYQIIMYYVERYIGDSETALRFPSAVAGILAIAVIYRLGKRLYSHWEGLIAAGLLAVLWASLYYSQEARAYSFLLLFALLTAYFWIALLQAVRTGLRPAFSSAAGYIISAGICSYLHYFGLYLVALQGLALVLIAIRQPRRILTVALVYLPIVLLYLPWTPIMWEQVRFGPRHIAPPETGPLTTSFYFLQFMFNWSTKLTLLVLAFYAVLAGRSLFGWLRYGEGGSNVGLAPGLWLTLWLVIPFIGAYLITVLFTPVLLFRNLIISLPAAYLLLSRAVVQLPAPPWGRILVAGGIILLFLYQLLFSMQYYTRPVKEQSREAVAYVAAREMAYPNALIISYPDRESFDYYLKKQGASARVAAVGGQPMDIPAVAQLLETEKPRYVWYIRAYESPDNKFVDYLFQNLELLEHQEFILSDVWLFKTRFEDTGLSGVNH
ncbi:MAG: hypothetical protein D6784_10000 [Chloroflexi bacterium]|nr:MAG: hypothetical protein D6784_10000 [Chloroflexota bacterium]